MAAKLLGRWKANFCLLAALLQHSAVLSQDILRQDPPSQYGEALAEVASPDDERLLDQIQRGCYNYFWNEVGEAEIARDRKKAPVSSIAAVGFQLASLPISVERGLMNRQLAQQRRVLQ